ncbi:FAD-dependent monooxygenase [Sphaerotilus sp.]|uniref:FAD-dependent monooxygenase n=1 Tax=Sphaerotilus sp. TaxID=2093942 RepID=UPI0025D8E3AD|nr:FAD-dependent monooxygenase [Sphaerotilus sp.]
MSAVLAGASGLRLAVIGAGPVGLALALAAARRLPTAQVCVYDRLPVGHDVSGDPRTLALSQGSVLALQRLGVWAAMAERAEPIQAVHVSQQQPGLLDLLGGGPAPELLIRAVDEGVPQLGAVIPYGALAAPMRAAWLAACAQAPQRLSVRWGEAVSGVRPVSGGVEIDVGVGGAAGALVEPHDLAVVAEGGVFADQARKAIARDYGQTAWVGTVGLEGGEVGVAHERFTPQGPVALLPLPGTTLADDGRTVRRRAALVWCVDQRDDAVAALTEAQRLAVLTHLLPARVGRLVSISPLKSFALGLNAERTLVQGRTVRIGNAAQTLHPVAGQGLNLGLRDAHELVARLARHSDVDQALRRVEWQRAPDRWAMIAATDFLARSFTWPWPGLSTLRGAGLAALGQVGPLRSLLARRMMFGGR